MKLLILVCLCATTLGLGNLISIDSTLITVSKRGNLVVKMDSFAPIPKNSKVIIEINRQVLAECKVLSLNENKILLRITKNNGYNPSPGSRIQLKYKSTMAKLGGGNNSADQIEKDAIHDVPPTKDFSVVGHAVLGASKPNNVSDVPYGLTYGVKFYYKVSEFFLAGFHYYQANYKPTNFVNEVSVQKFSLELAVPLYSPGNFAFGIYGGYPVYLSAAADGVSLLKNRNEEVLNVSPYEQKEIYGGVFGFYRPYSRIGFRMDLGLDILSIGVGGFF